MAEPQFKIIENGSQVLIQDLELLGYVAAMADDRVLAELVRPRPFTGDSFGIYKAILPYARTTAPGESAGITTPQATGTVVPPPPDPGGRTQSVLVRPFRAIIGTRTLASISTPPATPISDSVAMQNWHEIRSQIVVGAYQPLRGGGTPLADDSLGQFVSVPADPGGLPRWDLVYAQVTIDGQSTTLRSGKVKGPDDMHVSVKPTTAIVAQSVHVLVVKGTPGATPALPTLPADTTTEFNIPLAYVMAPDPLSIPSTGDIREVAPIATFNPHATGAPVARPANGNNDGAGTYAATSGFGWTAGSHVRPALFLPPSMQGETTIYVQIDASAASSHPSGSVVDNSIDWRNRFFKVDWQFANTTSGTKFSTDPTVSSGLTLPNPFIAQQATQFGNSLIADGGAGAGTSIVLFSQNTVPSPGTVFLYVDQTDGQLKVSYSGTPRHRVWARVTASGQMPNR